MAVRLADGVAVGLLLWRAQLRMFLNQTVRSRKPGRIAATVVGAVVILLAWSWEGFVTRLAVEASQRVAVQIDPVQLFSFAFLAYTTVLVFSSLVFSLNALLLNPDLDLLLAAPRPVESILAGRMVAQLIRLLLLSLLFTGPALVVLTLALPNPLVLVGFTGLYLVYPVFVVVIVSLLSLLVVRFISPGRGREILTLLGVALALGINLLNFLINPALRNSTLGRPVKGPPALPDIPIASTPWLPPGWAGRTAAATLTGDWLAAGAWGLLLLGVSVVVFAAGTVVSGRLYLAGWIQAVPPRRRPAVGARRRLPNGLPLLDPVLATIVIKDWRMRTRDVAQLVRFAMPAVFLLIIFGLRFPQLLSAGQSFGQGPTAAMIALIPAWILLFSLSMSIGLTAVSLEGKSIWVYAASPNSMLRLLQGKCWSTALPTIVLVALVAVVAETILHPGVGWAATAVLLAIAQTATVTTLMVGIGAVFARFDWTDARRMLHPVAVFIGMVLFTLISSVSALLLVIAIALAGATRFPIFSTWLAALTISVGGAAALAALGMLFGNQRLRALELG